MGGSGTLSFGCASADRGSNHRANRIACAGDMTGSLANQDLTAAPVPMDTSPVAKYQGELSRARRMNASAIRLCEAASGAVAAGLGRPGHDRLHQTEDQLRPRLARHIVRAASVCREVRGHE